MILKNSDDLILKIISEEDLEMVRNWRNDPKITQYLHASEYITPEMQKKWFANLDKEHNYYFIIIYNNIPIGLTQIRKIDYSKKIAEPGIFIYEDKYLNGILAYRVIFTLMDFAFYKLNLEKLQAEIFASNKRAVRFNKSIGYAKVDKDSEWYEVDEKKYSECKLKLENILK